MADMLNTTYRGSAVNDGVTLAAPLHVGDNTAQVSGDLSGWPNGADHRSFTVQVDGGRTAEERLLCSVISGSNPATVTIITRGFDGTAEVEHSVSATFEHDLDAQAIDRLVLHVVDPALDDHEQYLTNARHQDPTLHTFGDGEAYGVPSTPAPIVPTATGPSVGVADGPPRADHHHVLGAGAIDAPGLFGATVVAESALEDGAVSTRVLADGAVTTDKVGAGVALTAVANHDVVSPNIPDGTKTPLWKQLDKDRIFAWLASAWRWIAGKPLEVRLSYHADGNDIANDFAVHTLNQFTADSDELATASAGSTITVPPANTPGNATNNIDVAGEWLFEGRILASGAGAGAGATFQLWLVAGGVNYLVWSGANAPGHSTLMPFRQRVRGLTASQTALLQLAHSAPAPVHIAAGSTFEARYVGP